MKPDQPAKSNLDTIIREKGKKKYEQQCSQLLCIVTRLRPKIGAALADYTREHPPREFVDGRDINIVATVLYIIINRKEQRIKTEYNGSQKNRTRIAMSRITQPYG